MTEGRNHNILKGKQTTSSRHTKTTRASLRASLFVRTKKALSPKWPLGGGYLNTTGDRWIQVTSLVNIMIHTTFAQSNLSICSAVVNPLFLSTSKRAGESLATSAGAKQEPVHCAAMVAEKN